MRQKLFSVYDRKVESYQLPFAQPTDAAAVRAVQMNLQQDKDSMAAANPADFALYYVGEFDILSGEIKAQCPPSFLVSFDSLVNKVQ